MCQIKRNKYKINCLHFKKALGKSTFLNSENLPKIQLFFSFCLRFRSNHLVAVTIRLSIGWHCAFPGFEQKSTSTPEDERWRLSVRLGVTQVKSYGSHSWCILKASIALFCDVSSPQVSWVWGYECDPTDRRGSVSWMWVPGGGGRSLRLLPTKVPAPSFWSFLGVFHRGCTGALWHPPPWL